MSVFDSGSSLVDRAGQLQLVDLGLQSSLEELFGGKTQAVIELVLGLRVQKAKLEHSVQQGSALEESDRVVFWESKEGSGSLSDLGQSELNSPDFSLVLEAESSASLNSELKISLLRENSFLFERTTRSLVSVSV